MSPVLTADEVTKQFAKGDEAIVALREFTVDIAESSFVTVLGRSGCGTDAKAVDALAPILRDEIAETPDVQRAAYDTARTFHLDSGLVRKAPTYEEVLFSGPAV